MSFYLGKDNSTNYILHTTNKQESEGAMKSGVLDSTTFHSSLPYFQVFYEDAIQLRKYSYSDQHGSWYTYSAMFSMESIDLILQGYLYSVIVNTSKSGNQDCAIPSASSAFNTQNGAGVYPDFAWGPTDSPYTWPNSYHQPSSVNRYADITFYNGTTADVLGATANDILNSTVGRVVFYNIKNNDLITQPATSKVQITPSQFIITTPTQTVDMNNFEPLRVSTASSAGAFKVNASGDLYVQPITRSKFSTIKWEIDSRNPSNCIINKYTSDGTKHQIIGNDLKNLVFSKIVSFPYSVTAKGGITTSPGFMTIGNDEIATVVVEGTFSNGILNGAYCKGSVPFVNRTNQNYQVSTAETVKVKNDSYKCDRYKLYVSVQNGVIYLKNSAVRWCSDSAIAGTFSGTLKVFIFKIK